MSDFKNFAMMIPKYGIHVINGCQVWNATGEEFDRFKVWVDSGEIIQLKANDTFVDLWINKKYEVYGMIVKPLNDWFDQWKKPPQKGYSFKSYNIKVP